MANVVVIQAHSLGRDRGKAALSSFETMLAKYRVKLDWSGHSAKIKGVGVGGDVQVTDNQVKVTVELGMLARAAGIDATRLQASITKRLQEAFSQPS